MSKNFNEITLTSTNTEQSMVGMPGIISVSGVQGGATDVSVIATHDENVIANNTALLALATGTDPVVDNPVSVTVPGIAFNVQAERLTFRLVGTPSGTTNITVRWFLVGTPY